MKAISIRQPWAWAICHAGKRVENREWQAVPSYRGPLLIHAAKGCTRDEHEDAIGFMCDIGALRVGEATQANLATPIPPRWASTVRGALVARARLIEVVRTTDKRHRLTPGTSGPCLLCGDHPERYQGGVQWRFDCPKADPWAVPGALGLILADVVPLGTPVPFKGSLGFFDVPEELLGGAS